MLEPFGISTVTEARFDLFAAVPPPPETEFTRTEATSLTLSLGDVQRLRGALRHVVNNLLGALNDGLMVAQMTGTPIEDLVAQAGIDVEANLTQILNLEDVLSEAWAAVEAAAVDFTVPDYAPDPSL